MTNRMKLTDIDLLTELEIQKFAEPVNNFKNYRFKKNK